VERRLIGEFEQSLETLLSTLTSEKLPQAAEIVDLTKQIRGYGHIKLESYAKVRPDWEAKLKTYQGIAAAPAAAAKPSAVRL
jgi:indolepyruvate ferredoxin oxidoreductase